MAQFAEQIFGFLNIPLLQVLSMSTDALPLMQSRPAKRLEKAHESLLRERQISVMLSSLRLWSLEAEIGWHWPMLVFI